MLIKAGADVNAGEGGVSPLLLASQSGSTKLIQMLVAKGASVQARADCGHCWPRPTYRAHVMTPRTAPILSTPHPDGHLPLLTVT